MAMAFVWSTTSFIGLRFLLGVPRPGSSWDAAYFTFWFPSAHRGRMVAGSASRRRSRWHRRAYFVYLMLLDGAWGSRVEVALRREGCRLWSRDRLLVYLVDGPTKASWLTQEERIGSPPRWSASAARSPARTPYLDVEALVNPRVWALGIIYLGIVTPSVGLVLFAADHQAGRAVEFRDRVCHPIPYMRGSWECSSGASVGPDERAALELFAGCVLSAAAMVFAGRWSDDRRGRRDVPGEVGFYGSKALLVAAQHDLERTAGGRARLHQLARNLGGWFGRRSSAGSRQDRRVPGGLYALSGFCVLAAVVTVIGVAVPRRRVPSSRPAE